MTDTHSPILQALLALPGHAAQATGRAGKQRKSAAPAPAFQIQGQLPLHALAVQVAGMGALPQPLGSAQAQALHALTQPAPFGRREATLHDTRVRDTGEIDAQALTLDWDDGALAALQAAVAQALGLQALELRAHKLLVYGPGQFFKPHQDTEKHAGMVGTLVLVWPSAHIGGGLVVEHGDEKVPFASQHLQADTLRWCAFYADCRHEVLPVEEGWRVVLTFDLVVPASARQISAPVDAPLLAALRAECFAQGEPSTEPWVFLLDHEYSERGLRWELLKGQDRPRVLTLRAAAQALGAHVYLALAEIHESWTASYSAPRGRYGGRYGGRHDDGDPEPDELIDDSLVLNHWIDASGKAVRRKDLRLRPDATESFTDTGEDFLVDEEHQGYMGNYGDTLDYWYRRAALVIETPLAQEAGRFVTDFDAALADAVQLARRGDGAALAQRLYASWQVLLQHASHARWSDYAALACALPEAERASALCEKFQWPQLLPADVPPMARLAQRWGEDWLRALVQAWLHALQTGANRWHWVNQDLQAPWPQPLPAFIAACQAAALAPALVQQMLHACVGTLAGWDTPQATRSPAKRLHGRAQRIAQVADLALALQRLPEPGALLRQLLAHVRALPDLYPLLELCPLVQALLPACASLPEAQQLHADVAAALQAALAQPQLPDSDRSSVGVQWACRCADCTRAIAWAEAPGDQALTLAMAEARRTHVQERLNQSTAQFGFETVKKGSPYQLVIRKIENLPLRRQQQRERWLRDWAVLAPKGKDSERVEGRIQVRGATRLNEA